MLSSVVHAEVCAFWGVAQVHSNGPVLDDEILADPEVQAAIKDEGSVHRKFSIVNTDRAAFGRVGGAVAKLHGDSGFAGTLSFDLEVGLFLVLPITGLKRAQTGMYTGLEK